MPLIRNGHLAADTWLTLADDAPLPEGQPVIVSLARFKAEREALSGRNAPVGVRLKSSESPLDLAESLDRLSLVAVEFPSFRDGRGFSHARRLRGQLRFKGELRAVGHLIPDQALFLIRCGFDTIEVKDTAKLTDWQRGLSEFSVWYQPALDERVTAIARRHGRAPRAYEAAE